jgi:hypothetical protein
VFLRWLQVIAVIVYIFAAIGAVAYLGLSFFWLIPLLGPAIYFIFTFKDLTPSQPSHGYFISNPQYRAKLDARIEELKNGPPHRNKPQYIDAVRRGISFSDDRIDYLEFPEKLVLCEHLRPLEAAMRAANLPMDHNAPGQIEAQCIMQVALIRQQIPLADCVQFSSIAGPHAHGPSVQIASCSLCQHVIEEGICGAPWPAEIKPSDSRH